MLGFLLAPAGMPSARGAELPLPARAEAGKADQQAERLVQRALHARLRGDEAGCRKLLDEALALRPDYPRALWLSGHVHEQDRWVAVDEHQGRAAISPLLDQYEEQRKRVGQDPKREWTLAKWCDREGLTAQRDFHFGRLFASGRLTERQAKEVVQVLDLELAGGQFWKKEEFPDTGELSYKVVTTPTAGLPNSGMTQMRFGDNEVHITHGHVVWVNGKGWEIVRRVAPGDQLASLSGSSKVTHMTDRPVTPLVHNLVVEDFHTFFVGRDGILVHDITYVTFRQPTQAVVPGLLASHVKGEVD